MIGVRVDVSHFGRHVRQDFAGDVADLLAVDFICIEEQDPVRRFGERAHARERAIAHVGEIEERIAVHAQRAARRERARFERRGIVAARQTRIVVDDQKIDRARYGLQSRAEIRFAGRPNAECAGDRDR